MSSNLNPFKTHLFSSRNDALDFLSLCNEAQIELEQHLSLIQSQDADLIPSATARLIQSIQAHCLDCFRMEGLCDNKK